MKIHYGLSRDAASLFFGTLKQFASSRDVRTVCEIGGGANPVFDREFVLQHGLEYTIVDVSEEELAKAPPGYHKLQADITRADHGIQDRFDMIFSVWCAEHVPDGKAFHRNILERLNEGGVALHIFPTLYSVPFLVNRLIPERLSSRILTWLQPHRAPEGNHAKFPAYYSWCRGPSRRQLARLEGLGYAVEEYGAFYGHSGAVAFGEGYLERIPLLCRLHECLCRWLQRFPTPWLTTNAYVVLRKPTQSTVLLENYSAMDKVSDPWLAQTDQDETCEAALT